MSTSAVNDLPRCQWCGNFHQTKCPMVKSIEYQDGGIFIKRVEFFAPKDYPREPQVIAAGPLGPTVAR